MTDVYSLPYPVHTGHSVFKKSIRRFFEENVEWEIYHEVLRTGSDIK